jgi:ParB family chromosome partitioning protein
MERLRERLPQYDTFAVPVKAIYYDPSFNCRDDFTLDSVKELADSIAKHGLTYPVIIQPWDQEPGYDYRLLAGHRRFKAVTTYLSWETIPASVRESLSEWEARKLNFIENLERKDLNLLEEAKAVRRLFPNGATINEVKTELNRPYRWAYIRLRLLQLPEPIQKMVAAGLLLKGDIETLDRIEEGKEAQLQAAEAIIANRRERKSRKPVTRGKMPNAAHRVKTRDQINAMVAQMLEMGITGLPPRVAAWCAGHITDADLAVDLQKEKVGRQQRI